MPALLRMPGLNTRDGRGLQGRGGVHNPHVLITEHQPLSSKTGLLAMVGTCAQLACILSEIGLLALRRLLACSFRGCTGAEPDQAGGAATRLGAGPEARGRSWGCRHRIHGFFQTWGRCSVRLGARTGDPGGCDSSGACIAQAAPGHA